MPRKSLIQIRRGLEREMGTLSVGELGYCTDTSKLYIGTDTGNELLIASQSSGDMLKSIYDTNNDGKVDYASQADNASKVNNLTVLSAVPANAKFTDTTYSPATSSSAGLMSTGDKSKLDAISINVSAETVANGSIDPMWYALRHGKQLYLDEDFKLGTNSVGAYNNSGGDGVVITRVAMNDAPNNSKFVLKIVHNGSTTTPGLGGFVQTIQSKANAVFVNLFRAKLPVGYSLQVLSNNLGNNSKDFLLSNNQGTGKWETYIRVTMCGDSGTFHDGGHIYVVGSPAPSTNANLEWYLASATQFELTARNIVTWGQLKGE
ncbi:hypothetical protein [Paenibacillus assamensis]|uniref:hyaluronate lyase N-terminal domain-containing protein n=1 Tax=Paenibacillus assamensis TaxID=311244 RepID=UPI0004147ABC|nr:hypothetical protein [Paenibacillus assamensis]